MRTVEGLSGAGIDELMINPENEKSGIMNMPTYEQILSVSKLSSQEFSLDRYHEYRESLNERATDIDKQIKYLRSKIEQVDRTIEKIKNNAAGKISKASLEMGSRLALIFHDLLGEAERAYVSMVGQGDLFITKLNPHSVLVEEQMHNLTGQLRELKVLLNQVLSVGNLQAPGKSGSRLIDRGISQMDGDEARVNYARHDYMPEAIEESLARTIDIPSELAQRTMLMSSGMASLRTIFVELRTQYPGQKFYFPNESYFEVDDAIDLLKDEGVDVEPYQPSLAGIDKLIDQKPNVIFAEKVANSSGMPVVDLKEIMDGGAQGKRSIVIDYTVCGPNAHFEDIWAHLRPDDVLFLVTSLQKLYQQGDDVAPAGMVTIVGEKADLIQDVHGRLLALRGLLGTGMTLRESLALSHTDAAITKKYARRIGQNVSRLSAEISGSPSPLLNNVVNAPEVSEGVSEAAVFFIHFKRPEAKKFIDYVIKEAGQQEETKQLSIVQGESFGYRHTRLTTNDPRVVRVAPGTENEREIALIGKLFVDVIEKMGSLA